MRKGKVIHRGGIKDDTGSKECEQYSIGIRDIIDRVCNCTGDIFFKTCAEI